MQQKQDQAAFRHGQAFSLPDRRPRLRVERIWRQIGVSHGVGGGVACVQPQPFGEGDNMLSEFKKFAMRGNVVDLAIGVIIGAAFGNIVTSIVSDVFMPIIGWVTGGLDFSNYFIALGKDVTALSYEEAKKQGAVIGYGRFITLAVNFLIVAWVLFLVVRFINKLRAKEEKPAATAPDVLLLTEIRDLLAEKKSPI